VTGAAARFGLRFAGFSASGKVDTGLDRDKTLAGFKQRTEGRLPIPND
jgi:hypothetical protein